MSEDKRIEPVRLVGLVIDRGEEIPPHQVYDLNTGASGAPAAAGTTKSGAARRRRTGELAAVPSSGGAGDARSRESEGALPEGCPITPLGVDGDTSFYLDALRQLRPVKAKDHARTTLMHMFGTQSYLLEKHWPRKSADGHVTGWKPEKVAEDLMSAAARKGKWNAADAVRGRGAWRHASGELVLHCGDVVYVGDVAHEPGLIGRHVYPGRPPILRPALEHQAAGDRGPAALTLSLLSTWKFRRGALDARLALGWIGAAMLSGALDWRPLIFVTGGQGTGKSTLFKVLEKLFAGSLLVVADATAAGIRQSIGDSALPVALDELESEEENRAQTAIVKLARLAASGSKGVRGGSDHNETLFSERSCFAFGAILMPPMPSQDRSRMAILELNQLGAELAPLPAETVLAELGARLLRRLRQSWARFPQAFEAYRAALMAAGYNPRGVDVFGTLLACADILEHDTATDADSAEELARALASSTGGLGDAGDLVDEEKCLQFLLTSPIPPDGGGIRRSIGDYITTHEDADFIGEQASIDKMLGTYGLRVLDDRGQRMLAIANYHSGLARIFRGEIWASSVWVQALRRLPEARASEAGVRFAGALSRATLIPVAHALAPSDKSARSAAHTALI